MYHGLVRGKDFYWQDEHETNKNQRLQEFAQNTKLMIAESPSCLNAMLLYIKNIEAAIGWQWV